MDRPHLRCARFSIDEHDHVLPVDAKLRPTAACDAASFFDGFNRTCDYDPKKSFIGRMRGTCARRKQ
ncbi:hypothetical protein [Lysobacter brunescens]|uniref:Uncharacterized protein n=1 Tax=Lysobacter brunescens TaxID=262323 RepID=A0ABW2YAC6_9GAMM